MESDLKRLFEEWWTDPPGFDTDVRSYRVAIWGGARQECSDVRNSDSRSSPSTSLTMIDMVTIKQTSEALSVSFEETSRCGPPQQPYHAYCL